MKEGTCPKCNNIQKIGSANICSYCYYKFDSSNKLDVILTSVETELSDNQIIGILDLKKEPYKQESSEFFFKAGIFFTISFLIFFIDYKAFPFVVSEAYFLGLSLVASFFTTYFYYRYLGKFFYLQELASSIFYKSRWGTEPTKFEQIFYLVFVMFFMNFFFDYFSLYAFNDFSSIIFPAQTHEVFVSKAYDRVKGGYNYYLSVTNWKKDQNPNIKIKISQIEWDKYIDQKSAKIKVKNSFIEVVVWRITQ